jgi:hypothetical protein
MLNLHKIDKLNDTQSLEHGILEIHVKPESFKTAILILAKSFNYTQFIEYRTLEVRVKRRKHML